MWIRKWNIICASVLVSNLVWGGDILGLTLLISGSCIGNLLYYIENSSRLFTSGSGPVVSHLWDDGASGFHQKDITGCPLNGSGRVKAVKWFHGEPRVLHKFHGLRAHFISLNLFKRWKKNPDLNQRDADTHDWSQIQHKPQEEKTKEDLGDMNNKVGCILSFLEEDWKLD